MDGCLNIFHHIHCFKVRKSGTMKVSKYFCGGSYQFSLDGEDSISSCLTVALLSRDDDHLGVAVLRRQVDLSVGLLPDLVASTTAVTFRLRFQG